MSWQTSLPAGTNLNACTCKRKLRVCVRVFGPVKPQAGDVIHVVVVVVGSRVSHLARLRARYLAHRRPPQARRSSRQMCILYFPAKRQLNDC